MNLKLYLTFLLLVVTNLVVAQQKTVVGTVVDEDGISLPGASILIQGTDFGTSTDENGVFSINVAENQVLEVSYVFFHTQYVTIGAKNDYRIVLKSEDSIMDDIVVVAYGTATKESITGAVASIGAAAIESRPVSNAAAALEGAAAGLQVNNTSGAPGSSPDIRIRGFTTINGSNSPLIVVDGTPYPGSMSDINPVDIESMSVLKDASASTLYGNRASNGVIMINTKKGSKGQGFLTATAKQGFYERGIKEYEKLGPDQWMETMWKSMRNRYYNDPNQPDYYQNLAAANAYTNDRFIAEVAKLNIYNAPDTELFDENGKLRPGVSMLPGYAGDLDWFAPVERTGYRQEYTVNGRVANEKGGAYFSLGMLDDQGYLNHSDYKRFTARVSADYQAKDWLKVGGNVAGSNQKSNLVNGESAGSYTNPFMYARSIAPIYPVYLHDKATGDYMLDDSGNRIFDRGGDKFSGRQQYLDRHVVYENDLNTEENIKTTVNGQFYGEATFLRDFTFTLKGDLSLRNSDTEKYENAIIGDGSGNNGRSRRGNYRYESYTAQQLLNWSRSFGDHHVEALVGHENYSEKYNYIYGMMGGQNVPGKVDWSNFNTPIGFDSYKNVYRTEGYLSRVKYDYNNKYFGEASFRRDGSSKFHKDSRWGNFWSLGAGWIISSEDFFKVSQIDYLKLRMSYGEVGNDTGSGWYGYQTFFTMNTNGAYGAFYKGQMGNRDLKWETSASLDVGLEMRLFKVVNLTVEYFDKKSNNLLFDLKQALSEGATTTGSANSILTKNMGEISNRGLELTADVDIIRKGDWRWNVGANATFMKNKVVSLPPENRENGILNGTKKIVEGGSIYDFYLYQYVGVDTETGRALYEFNHDDYYIGTAIEGKSAATDTEQFKEIDGKYYALSSTYAKKEFEGTAIPDVYGSFNTSVSYKGFYMSALFTYSIGGKVYDASYAGLLSSSSPRAMHIDLLNSYDPTNPIDQPILYGGMPALDMTNSTFNNMGTSNRFLKDASYLSVKNITIGYDFPAALLDKMGVSKLSLSAGVENLTSFTKLKGMNPQQSFNGTNNDYWVTPRIYSLSLSLSL